MLLILLSWFYIFIIAVIFGASIKNALKLIYLDTIITLLFGLFGITLLTAFWAIFYAVNENFQLLLFLVSLGLLMMNRSVIKNELVNLKTSFNQLALLFKIIIIVLLLLTLAQCASPPFIIDNESYYIQTIKWLNNYGFVKGLVNLHLFLGQTSGWHILQSTFSFSFIYDSFNDISGFCLLLGNFYALIRLNAYFKNSDKNQSDLIIGLFPLFNVFFFQFIAAPSPDIAIFVLSLIIFHQFIICFNKYKKNAFIAIFLLSIFATLIKLTGLIFFFLALFLYFKHFQKAKKTTVSMLIIGLLTLGLFIVKNVIVTGNAIYPLAGIESLTANWALPKTIETYFANYSQASGYGLTVEAYDKISNFQLFKNWLMLSKLDGIFNKLMILLFVISPFFILRLKNKKAFSIIYCLAILNLLFLFSRSPQYRFFFPFLIYLLLVILSFVFRKRTLIYGMVLGSTLLIIIPLFFQLNNSALTNTNFHTASSTFSIDYLVKPHGNSKYSPEYQTLQIKNTRINSPTKIDFFWGTGDIPLPALNNTQLEYFKINFNVIPQQRSENIKDGFYSKTVINN